MVQYHCKALYGRQRRRSGVRADESHGGRLVQYEDAVRDTMKRRSFETYLDIARLCTCCPPFGIRRSRT
jgi:hypothetical protein